MNEKKHDLSPSPKEQHDMPAQAEQAYQTLFAAQMVVNQGYLDQAAELPVVPFEETGVRQLRELDTVRLYNISKIVYDRRVDALNNLLNVYSALGNAYGLAFIIKSEKKSTSLYLAIRAYNSNYPASKGGNILNRAIAGHFSGSSVTMLDAREDAAILTGVRGYMHKEGNWGISAAVAVPSLKDEEKIAFTQGIDRLMDAMEGQEYTAILLAEPYSKQDTLEVQNAYSDILSSLYACEKQQLTLSQRQSGTISTASTSSFSTTLMRSLTRTQTHSVNETHTKSHTVSHTTSHSKTSGSTWNFNLGGAASLAGGAIGFVGGPIGAMIGMQLGGAVGGMLPTFSSSESTTETTSDTTSDGTSSTVQQGTGNSTGDTEAIQVQQQNGKTDTASYSKDTGISTVIELRNAQVERLAQKIESHLDRIDTIRSFGAWKAGAFFLSPDAEIASTAASIYLGMLRGEDTHLGNATIITWQGDTHKKAVLGNLAELSIPRLVLASQGTEVLPVAPATMISSRELALMMNFPRRSVGGIAVLDGVSFGREPRLLHEVVQNDKRQIHLGSIYHLFQKRPATVTLNRDDFTKHVLVTGTTGTGKSTSIRYILQQIHRQKIPFLVLEPAKSEYANLASLGTADKPVHVFQVGGKESENSLRLNPFVFPQEGNITLMEHIDRVCSLFNAAFPMYAAMPQILEEAVVSAYERYGWDITSSLFTGQNATPLFPTLRDVAEEIEDIVKGAGYEGEARGTYIGALKTRIISLTRGSLGLTFSVSQNEETPQDKLFEQPCIVNLASLGSAEKKAIVMGMLLIRLQEYRLAKGQPENDHLRHLIVVEEAHNLLKSSGDAANMEAANPRGQAIEYFSNLIAELRAYGQGFLIADQSVSALDAAVQRNTNTKIAFCAPFETDREILAGALSLDEEQKNSLARLESYTAIVKQNDWADAVQCRIDEQANTHFPPTASDIKHSLGKNTCPIFAKAMQLVAAASAPQQSINKGNDAPDDMDMLLWIQTNGVLFPGAFELWKAIVRGESATLSERQIAQSLYVFPESKRILDSALQCTCTYQGLISRLRVEISNTGIFPSGTMTEINRMVYLLLLCVEKYPQRVADALQQIESERSS